MILSSYPQACFYKMFTILNGKNVTTVEMEPQRNSDNSVGEHKKIFQCGRVVNSRPRRVKLRMLTVYAANILDSLLKVGCF